MSEEKTHPEHKYSVTFVSKVGTKKQPRIKVHKDLKWVPENCFQIMCDKFI